MYDGFLHFVKEKRTLNKTLWHNDKDPTSATKTKRKYLYSHLL